MELAAMKGRDLIELLQRREIACVDVMRSVLDRIERSERRIQAYTCLRDSDELLAEAAAVDARRRDGEAVGALAGLPVAVKDNICTRGIVTSCASRMLADHVPPYDAAVVERVRRADGIVLGKTNLDEFAMGSSTENSALQVTRNPWHPEHVPGGTSGGSAAAVAEHETILALGTDTGGSIRQPASFCGVVGLKPTYGRVSRYGLIAYASSLDHIGPLTKDVRDAELLFAVIAGHDPRDSTSLRVAVRPEKGRGAQERPLRIGVPKEYFADGLDGEVRAAVTNAMSLLESAGHRLVEVTLPHTEYATAAYYLIASAEASSNLARYDGGEYGFRGGGGTLKEMIRRTRSEGFGAEVKRRILLGAFVLSAGYHDATYLRATKVRTVIRRDFADAWRSCDVIIHPVAPTAAFKLGEKMHDPLAMYLGDIYSVAANLAGLPALSLPCGWNRKGLPIGVQLVSDALAEPLLFRAAGELESLLATGDRPPPGPVDRPAGS